MYKKIFKKQKGHVHLKEAVFFLKKDKKIDRMAVNAFT